MSAEKVRLHKPLIGTIPKLLKHSASENHGRLPEIRPVKQQLRSTLEPNSMSDIKIRSSMCRTSSQ